MTAQYTVPLNALRGGQLRLNQGDYVQINGRTYRVDDIKDDTITITQVCGCSVQTQLQANQDVLRIDTAIKQDVNLTVNAEVTIPVTDVELYVPESTVVIGSMQGVIRSIDHQAGTITFLPQVSLDASAPFSVSVTEGTPVRRDVKGVASGYDVSGTDKVVNGVVANDPRMRNMNPFNPNADPDLFEYTFGTPKEAMLPTLTHKADFNGTVNGLTYYDGSINLTGSSQLCGTGILIVRGNLTVNGTCAEGFKGAIYVMGDYDQQGNSVINGGIVTEGSTEIIPGTECTIDPTSDGSGPGNTCDTKIAGTGQGSGKIEYDRSALFDASVALAPSKFPLVAGTWRQR